MSTTSSSPSPSESPGGVDEGIGPSDPGLRHFDNPSPPPSRRRSADAVWPEHFVEAVAIRVAVDASTSGGRLAAAPAIASFFQVCSTWRAVSRSELLWRELAGLVFSRHRALVPSWREEFVRLHRTALNFRSRNYTHHHFLPPSPSECCRLAVTDHHLAAGFLDGSVALFELPSCGHLTTYAPHPSRERLGRFSQSISGLILLFDRLIYASQDGYIHVADILDRDSWPCRRAHSGNLMEDGTLVDFSGDDKWWLGLYAGVPGRSFRVWDGAAEQILYIGGSLTDADAVAGWHLLTDPTVPSLGRVRVSGPGTMVACTASRLQVIDLEEDVGQVLNRLGIRRGALVGLVDACEGLVLVVDARGLAKVRRPRTLEEVCRFNTLRGGGGLRDAGDLVAGCMNWGYAVAGSAAGLIRVWNAVTGQFLYRFRERIVMARVLVASYRHVAAWSRDSGLHLWDFGAFVD